MQGIIGGRPGLHHSRDESHPALRISAINLRFEVKIVKISTGMRPEWIADELVG